MSISKILIALWQRDSVAIDDKSLGDDRVLCEMRRNGLIERRWFLTAKGRREAERAMSEVVKPRVIVGPEPDLSDIVRWR